MRNQNETTSLELASSIVAWDCPEIQGYIRNNMARWLRLVGSHTTADDLIQEFYLAYHRVMSDYVDPTRGRPAIISVLCRKFQWMVVDIHRQAQKREQAFGGRGSRNPHDPETAASMDIIDAVPDSRPQFDQNCLDSLLEGAPEFVVEFCKAAQDSNFELTNDDGKSVALGVFLSRLMGHNELTGNRYPSDVKKVRERIKKWAATSIVD